MTTEEMRRRISAVYNGLSWKKKVANMPERQVYAIYMSFKKNGKFDLDKKMKELKENVDKKSERYGHQMNISDMWPENLIMPCKQTNKMEEI